MTDLSSTASTVTPSSSSTAAAKEKEEAYLTIDIVTGASQGIGKAIAETIALYRNKQLTNSNNSINAKHHYKLVLIGRNRERGEQVVDLIKKKCTSSNLSVVFESCDLSDYEKVLLLKNKLTWATSTTDHQGNATVRVDILVNNAAECPETQQFVHLSRLDSPYNNNSSVGQESVDRQFASNVLSYHFMLRAFEEFLMNDSHVVMVGSNWAGDLDLNDLNFRNRTYDNDTAYRQSKQCNRLLGYMWSHRLSKTSKALVNGCHPGDPCTTLSKVLGYNLHSSPPSVDMVCNRTAIPFLCGLLEVKKGSTTTAITTTGGWYDGASLSSLYHPAKCQFSRMNSIAEKLFAICDSYCVS